MSELTLFCAGQHAALLWAALGCRRQLVSAEERAARASVAEDIERKLRDVVDQTDSYVKYRARARLRRRTRLASFGRVPSTAPQLYLAVSLTMPPRGNLWELSWHNRKMVAIGDDAFEAISSGEVTDRQSAYRYVHP